MATETTRKARFLALVGIGVVAGAYLGQFIRNDLIGWSVGLFLASGFMFVVAVIVGVNQSRREARQED